jgi:Predicted ATPase (AAA+ superfamily)
LLFEFDSICIVETTQLSKPTIITITEQTKLQTLQLQQPITHNHILKTHFLQNNDQLHLLTQPIKHTINTTILILSPQLNEQLQHLILHYHKHEHLTQNLNTSLKNINNNKIRTLFIDENSTKKTLTTNFLTSSFSTPLYQMNLTTIMNKYIGETEKNLNLIQRCRKTGS